MAAYYETSGVLNGVNECVELECAGTASGMISLSGDYVGWVEVLGRAVEGAPATTQHDIYKAGVGPLGTHRVWLDGQNDQQWLVVNGGYSIVICDKGRESGTLNVALSATQEGAITKITGPVLSAEELAVRDGRAFIGSTSVQGMNWKNSLAVTLRNPADSGMNMILTKRTFIAAVPFNRLPGYYRAFASPENQLAEQSNVVNRRIGGDVSVVEMFHEIIGTEIVASVEGSGQVIPSAGHALVVDMPAIIAPGQHIAFQIDGIQKNAGNIWSSMTFEWYEEPVA